MTYSTLASIVKYPFPSICAGKKSKFGYFVSEQADFQKIATELGLKRISTEEEPPVYARHPLVFLVEAADDICYQMMDIEDAYKLKLLTPRETKELYSLFLNEKQKNRVEEVFGLVSDENEQIAYLRATVIGILIKECTQVFMENEESILEGMFEGALIKHISPTLKEAYQQCSKIADKGHAYKQQYPELLCVLLAIYAISILRIIGNYDTNYPAYYWSFELQLNCVL